MPDFLQSLADNLKLQILAIAPDSARASLEGLPGVAFLGGAGLIGLILVWILFSLLGALFGGGKKRDEEEALAPRRAPESRREEPRRQTPPQQRPPQPAPAPAAPQPAPAQPGPDSRAAYQEAMQCGDAALQSGDPGGALNNYKHALDIARQQSATRPDDVDAQRATAQAMHRVGDTYALRKEFNLARRHHEQALVILRRLTDARPNDLTIARSGRHAGACGRGVCGNRRSRGRTQGLGRRIGDCREDRCRRSEEPGMGSFSSRHLRYDWQFE
jgi:hypothetical protein